MFRSKWQGAWRNNDSEYARSYPISKDAIRCIPTDEFRIIIKRNKDHRNGDNRPCYTFAFADESWANSISIVTSKDLQYACIAEFASELLSMLSDIEESIENAHHINHYEAPTETDEEFSFQGDMMNALECASENVDRLKKRLTYISKNSTREE